MNPEKGDFVMFRVPFTHWTEPEPYYYGIITGCYEKRYDVHCTNGITFFDLRKNRIIILAKA